MVAPPTHILGLDLHGTLLEPGEIIQDNMVEPVAEALRKLEGRVKRFICTGNDLDFVLRKVPSPILQQIDGCVLETGCSTSPDMKTEKVLTTEDERDNIAGLERLLRDAELPEINYFAHRLTTISMFCDDPRGFHQKVVEFVTPTEYMPKVLITYSSVAVDILPAGYDKYKGLYLVSEGLATVGVADSMNDKALLAEADYALAPKNLAPELVPVLEGGGRRVLDMAGQSGLVRNAVLKAARPETAGVVDILSFIDRALG